MKKTIFIMFFTLFIFSVPVLEANPLRSFDDLFPDISRAQKQRVFSERGFKNTFLKNEKPILAPASNSQIDLLSIAMEKKPTQLIESLLVVPYNGRTLNNLDAYNAIGRIENISKYLVFSPSRDRHIPLFEESTRLDDARRNRPIPDPPPATRMPPSETVYLRLKDTFFGNTYFRGDFSADSYGIMYNLTNNTAVWYLIFPVMRAEKFAAILYLEPLTEGMLVYSVAGIDIPEFLIEKINLAFNIDRRVTIIINWLSDGLKAIM